MYFGAVVTYANSTKGAVDRNPFEESLRNDGTGSERDGKWNYCVSELVFA